MTKNEKYVCYGVAAIGLYAGYKHLSMKKNPPNTAPTYSQVPNVPRGGNG